MLEITWIIVDPFINLPTSLVLSALPARLPKDDDQAYIHMDCEGGNPVGGNGPWKKKVNCSPHLEVALRPYVSGHRIQSL